MSHIFSLTEMLDIKVLEGDEEESEEDAAGEEFELRCLRFDSVSMLEENT